MATTTFCDWCGEQIEGAHPTLPLTVEARGQGEAGHHFFTQFGHYHGDKSNDDSCIYQVARLLQERARWAHDPEQESLEWRLMPRVRATDPNGGSPVGDEWSERVALGNPLYRLDLATKAIRALRDANLVTLEEVATRCPDEIASLSGVGPKTIARLHVELSELGLSWGESD